MKPMSNKFWRELNGERYRWAEQCYVDFLRLCDADRLIQSADNVASQVSIIVYGPSQVGKTSLILTLLGVKTSCFENVSHILRGGQPLGNSATACTYRYRVSEDDGWYFSHLEHGQRRFSDEEAKAVFAAIRKKMEHARGRMDSIDVFIPAVFFSSQRDHATRYVIRDLPGIQAAKAVERDYVTTLMGQYLSAADVVLLTGKVDFLGFLKPEELENALLRDWLWQSHRYKIILTRCYSDATLQMRLQQGEFTDAEALRDYLLKQINTLDLMLPEEMKGQLFPIECGNSWLHLQNKQDAYAHQCAALRRVYFDELHNQLDAATNPLSRLRSGFALPQFLSKQIARLAECVAADKQQRIEAVNRHIKQLKACAARLAKTNARLEGLHADKAAIDQRDSAFHFMPPLFSGWASALSAPQTVSQLKTHLDDARQALRQAWRTWCLENAVLPDISRQLLRSEKIDRLYDELSGYHLDKYWRAGNFAKDNQRVQSAIAADAHMLENSAANLSGVLREQQQTAIVRRIRSLQRGTRRFEHAMAFRREEINRLLASINQLTGDFAAQQAVLVSQLDASRRFKEVIKGAKKSRAHAINAQFFAAHATREQRVALLLAAKTLEKDYRYINMLGESA